MGNMQSYPMDEAAWYRVRLHGYVSDRLASNYGEMSAMVMLMDNGQTETELAGLVTDQAALVGLINMLYDLGHVVVAVERVESADSGVPTPLSSEAEENLKKGLE